ncbi:hypothetical protein LXL04_029361 [Taraxacum kok-saghyz]
MQNTHDQIWEPIRDVGSFNLPDSGSGMAEAEPSESNENTKAPENDTQDSTATKLSLQTHMHFGVEKLETMSIPNDVQEALKDEKWKKTMNEEMEALQKNET